MESIETPDTKSDELGPGSIQGALLGAKPEGAREKPKDELPTA